MDFVSWLLRVGLRGYFELDFVSWLLRVGYCVLDLTSWLLRVVLVRRGYFELDYVLWLLRVGPCLGEAVCDSAAGGATVLCDQGFSR